ESEGILAWMVRGCIEWQQIGLEVPERVKAATRDYRENEDSFGRWLAENCEMCANEETPSAELYADYKGWAAQGNEYVLSTVKWRGRMVEGLGRRRTARGVMWCGVGVV